MLAFDFLTFINVEYLNVCISIIINFLYLISFIFLSSLVFIHLASQPIKEVKIVQVIGGIGAAGSVYSGVKEIIKDGSEAVKKAGEYLNPNPSDNGNTGDSATSTNNDSNNKNE